jgi:hypothetical protein
MRRRGLWAAGVVLLLGVGVVAVGAGFANDEDDAGAKCSEATLHGMYLVAQHGVITEGPDQGPFAAAGREVYDGNGKVEGLFSFNFNGFVVSPPEPSSGTYTVKANCTGTTTYISEGARYETDLFIAPDGSMFTWVQTNPPERVASGFELQGTAKRVGD